MYRDMSMATNDPRRPGVPFDPLSPRGRKHHRIVTSTGGHKERCCMFFEKEFRKHAGNPRRQARHLHTILSLCLMDYRERLRQSTIYGYTEYEYRSDVEAFKAMKKLLRTVEPIVQGLLHGLSPERGFKLKIAFEALVRASRDWQSTLGIDKHSLAMPLRFE